MMAESMNAVGKSSPPPQVMIAYTVFGCCTFSVWHLVANGEFSSILTLSVMFQCLAIGLLVLQVLSSGSAQGISAKALMLEAMSLSFRLSSTTWLNGYLPVDASGDMVFQLVDVVSLLLVLFLLHRVQLVGHRTYQADEDSLPVLPMAMVALILAAFLHADMNSRPIFDTLWMAGLFVGVIAVLPQLWLITRTGGVVQTLTSHHIAMMAIAKILSGTFMWHARHDVSCAEWIEGYSHAIWAILGAHALNLLLLGDFAYYYMKAVASQGLSCQVDISGDICTYV